MTDVSKTGTAAFATGKQRGRPFEKGQSGNPAGKKPGTRSRATISAEVMLEGEAEKLTRKAIAMALDGDTTAMRLCLERILAPRRDRPVKLKLPPIVTAGDAIKAMAEIANAVGRGDITPGEGTDVAGLVERFAKLLDVAELEEKIAEIERQLGRGDGK